MLHVDHWTFTLTLFAMIPDIEAINTMLPWILLATMSFATALAVMKEPILAISISARNPANRAREAHTDCVHSQHFLKIRDRILQCGNFLLDASASNGTLKRSIERSSPRRDFCHGRNEVLFVGDVGLPVGGGHASQLRGFLESLPLRGGRVQDV